MNTWYVGTLDKVTIHVHLSLSFHCLHDPRQKLVADASSVESAPGRASSQDVESLSLWCQAHAGLSFLGLWLSRDLASRSARVFSLALEIFFLVSPLKEPFPNPTSGTSNTSPISLPSRSLASLSSLKKPIPSSPHLQCYTQSCHQSHFLPPQHQFGSQQAAPYSRKIYWTCPTAVQGGIVQRWPLQTFEMLG